MREINLLRTSYENFTETMKSFLNKSLGGLGQAYSQSSIFGAIFEGIKGICQNMMLYIEDALTEQNIFTATRKKSIYSLAKISGYEPFYGSAASGTVILSDKVSNSTDKIVIEDETVLTDSSSGLKYSLDLATDSIVIDLSKPLVTHEVKVIQGVWTRASITMTGEALETVEVTPSSLYDREYIHVYVNGEEYGVASCLYDMVEDEKSCVVKPGYEGGFYVMFGNGYHGKCIENGDQVDVKYIVHDGDDGNISPTDDVELKFQNTVSNVVGNPVEVNDLISITINNYICGGSDSDTIADVREMVGMNSRSLVIASEDNFKMFLKRFSFLGQFNLITTKNSLHVTCIPFSNFKKSITNSSDYLSLDKKDMLLTDAQKDMIKSALSNSNKAFTGVSIDFVNPIVRRYSVMCYVKIPTTLTKESIKIRIRESIASFFMSLSSDTLFISKSSLISKVMEDVTELSSFDVDFISEADEIARKNGWWMKKELHTVSGQLTYVDVRTIYDKTDKIGLDEVGNIRLKTSLEMPVIHKCTMTYDDWSQSQIEPVQFFFL